MSLFEIDNASLEEEETEEVRVGKGERSTVYVHPSNSKLHMRRAIKGAGSPNAREVCWLCGSHNGSYFYLNDDGENVTLIVTDKDMRP